MKTFRMCLFGVALTLLMGTPALGQTGHDLFQQALVKEQAEGDLRAAITLYERIVREFGDDRALAASALVQMGQCYERLGSREAQNAYRRVIDHYPEQATEVAMARERLASLGRMAAAGAGAARSSGIEVRQLWSGPYGDPVDFNGGPTPDGRGLVYIDWAHGSLAVRDLASGQARQVIGGDNYEEGYPIEAAVAPNGKLVAYTWWHSPSGTELRVVGLDGSAPTVLYTGPDIYSPSWSPDGRHIAVAVQQGDPARTGIILVSVDDRSARTLHTFSYPGVFAATLSHSPDGRFLAVDHPMEADSTRFDIELLSTADGRTLPLVTHPADDRLIGWVPGTSIVLFTSDRSGTRDLFGVRVGDDGRAGVPFPVRRAVGELAPMGFTADGSLFYSNYTLHYSLSVAPFDEAAGRIDFAATEPLLGSFDNTLPAWSPSGDQLVLVTREKEVGMPKQTGFAFRLRNLDSNSERILTREISPATIAGPRWLPDGRSLLVMGVAREDARRQGADARAALYRIDSRTGEATRYFDFPPDPSWWFDIGFAPLPDGESIVYIHDGALMLRHLSDQREVELYRDAQLCSSVLAVSPDGSEVFFGVNDPTSTLSSGQPDPRLQQGGRLMSIPSGGGDARVLTRITKPGRYSMVGWTPDGHYMLFLERAEIGNRRRGVAISRVARGGGEIEHLWETDQPVLALVPSPDGRRATYLMQENEAEIWVMENLVATLRAHQER